MIELLAVCLLSQREQYIQERPPDLSHLKVIATDPATGSLFLESSVADVSAP